MSVRMLLSDLLGLVRLGLFNLTVFKTCRVNTDCLWGSGWMENGILNSYSLFR